eukprot:2200641-Prymnesium_polylepis.1
MLQNAPKYASFFFVAKQHLSFREKGGGHAARPEPTRSPAGGPTRSTKTKATVHTVRVYTCDTVLSTCHSPVLALGVGLWGLY